MEEAKDSEVPEPPYKEGLDAPNTKAERVPGKATRPKAKGNAKAKAATKKLQKPKQKPRQRPGVGPGFQTQRRSMVARGVRVTALNLGLLRQKLSLNQASSQKRI